MIENLMIKTRTARITKPMIRKADLERQAWLPKIQISTSAINQNQESPEWAKNIKTGRRNELAAFTYSLAEYLASRSFNFCRGIKRFVL